jgi:hypothetical protein
MKQSEHAERQQPLSKAEKRTLLVGESFQNGEQVIEYWRSASDEMRGQALHQLLMLVDAVGHYPEKTEMFPGFPKRTRPLS